MGNVCTRPIVLDSPRPIVPDLMTFPEAGVPTQGVYQYPQPNRRPSNIVLPNSGTQLSQAGQNTPTAATTTTACSQPRANNAGPIQPPEVQGALQQHLPANPEQSDFVSADDIGIATGAEVAPAVPFSWQKGKQIGQGAFGTVFMALVHATGQEIAVKQVSLPSNSANNGKVSEHIRSLESEVALLRTLRHENIVRYLGTERTDEHLNIFLEYVPGGPISSKLAQFGPLREETIRVYTKQILKGLEYLHKQKVMHRDIKGANILVDTNGVVKLADFGASKHIELLTIGGDGSRSLRGTAHWMAPEVITQRGHGRPADIWSLGCVVIEMATGRPPWANLNPMAVMFHVASTKELPYMPDSLSAYAKDFITLCLNRVPQERPNATRLLQHPWMQGVNVPRSTGPPPSLPMIPAPVQLPRPQPQAPAPPAVQAPPPLPQQAPLGLRSPPSPIKEEADSRFGSPAGGPTNAGSGTPTTTRTAGFTTSTGANGVALPPFAQPMQQPPRPPVPPLPLDAMKQGTLQAQPAPSVPGPSSGRSIHQQGNLPPLPQHIVQAPPKPPLPPPQQTQQSARNAHAQNQQYDTLVDAEAVRMQLQRLQQQLQHQDCNDSICMGVGMTMAIGMTTGLPAPDALAEEYHASAMSISHINPVVEPSWMPHMVTPALLQQLAAVAEHSSSRSPSSSSSGGGAAAGPAHSGSGVRSGDTSSPDCPDVADTAKPTIAHAASLAACDMALSQVSPRSGAGTQRGQRRSSIKRQGPGTWTEGAGVKPVVVPSRPPLAGLFTAVGQEEGDTQIEPDQPSPAANNIVVPNAFSPNTVTKAQPRHSVAQHGTRSRISASRRVLVDAGILDPRMKECADELCAELEAARQRAAGGVMPPLESTSAAATVAYAVPLANRPSVADLF